jgi:hypothetical protein
MRARPIYDRAGRVPLDPPQTEARFVLRFWETPLAYKRDALLRRKTVRRHLDGVIRMVEAEAYCPDLMKQVAAV